MHTTTITFKRFDKEAIRSRTDIVDTIEKYGVPLKHVGKDYKGCCPFHDEKTPSFVVFPNTGTWHCFGACAEGGDVFDFVMKKENISFSEAIQRLGQDTGLVPIEGVRSYSPPKPPNKQDKQPVPQLPAQDWQNAMTKFRIRAECAIWQPQGARALNHMRERLDAGRGLPTEQIDALMRAMHLGYIHEGFDFDLCKDDGEPIWIPAGIVMPWLNEETGLTTIQIRTRPTLTQKSQYKFVSGSKTTVAPYIVGGTFVEGANTFITESVIKAAAAKLALPDWNCIGMGSASNPLPLWLLPKLRDCPNVYLAMDNDDSPDGRNAGQIAQQKLAAAIDTDNVRLCLIPFGKDVDGYIAEGGKLTDLLDAATAYAPQLPDSWRRAINAATNAVGLVIDIYLEARRALQIPIDGVTVKQLADASVALGRKCSEAIVRRGLAEAVKTGFFTKLPAPSTQNSEIEDREGEELAGKIVKYLNGRMPDRYQICGMDKIQEVIVKLTDARLTDRLAEKAREVPIIGARHIDAALSDEVNDPHQLHPEAEAIADDLNAKHGDHIRQQRNYDTRINRVGWKMAKLRRELSDLTSTSLSEGWEWGSVSQYKACVLRGLVDAGRITDWKDKQTQAPGKERLAYLASTSPRNVGKLAAAAGLILEENRTKVEVSKLEQISQLPYYDKDVGGAPLWVSCNDNIEASGPADSPKVQAAAIKHVAAGGVVKVTYQLASVIRVETDTQPPRPQKRVVYPVTEDTMTDTDTQRNKTPQYSDPASNVDLPQAPDYSAENAHSSAEEHNMLGDGSEFSTAIGVSSTKSCAQTSNSGMRVLIRLLVLVTSWQVYRDHHLFNRETGEITLITARTVIDLLYDRLPPQIVFDDDVCELNDG